MVDFDMADRQAIAFAGPRLIASGPLLEVALRAKAALDQTDRHPIAVFDRRTSEPIDLDFRGSLEDVAKRLRDQAAAAPRGRGRPKLGVMAREVTLLPRHWAWLAEQRGGASAALRRLVEEARQTHRTADQTRQSRQSAYQFVTAMAGDEAGYEEAVRALFKGDGPRFRSLIKGWPQDVRQHAEHLARLGLEDPPTVVSAAQPDTDAPWTAGPAKAVLEAAVTAAFGARQVQSADRLTSGASAAALWRLKVDETDYVLRLDAPRNAVQDPSRHVACLRLAAEAGLAPPLLHADPVTGVTVSAFIAAEPANPPLTRLQRLKATTEAVARLHSGPRFPDHGDYLETLNGLLQAFAGRGILPASVTAGPLAAFAALMGAYPQDPDDLVASHNDLNPGNVIFQGSRPWIVDWDSAFAAPRYVDLAALATFQAVDDAETTLMLSLYLGGPPEPRQTARFFLMRQANRLFYAAMLLNAADQERPTRLTDAEAQGHTLDAIRDQMATLAGYEGRVAFGCAFFNQAADAMKEPEFKAALTQA